jgi:hypothetical protein
MVFCQETKRLHTGGLASSEPTIVCVLQGQNCWEPHWSSGILRECRKRSGACWVRPDRSGLKEPTTKAAPSMLHAWVRGLDRGTGVGMAPFHTPVAPIGATVDVLREHHVDVRWNAPAVTAEPVATRGRHVNVSITREAKRADERRATLRAGQRAPEATRGKTCVEVGRIPGRVPPSAMALPGAPYKSGSTIDDGEGLACSMEHDAAWSALCEANAHHADMSAELTFAEDGAAIGTSTAAMVRGAQARLKSAMARVQRAQARYDAAVDAWVALSQVRAEDARDADAVRVKRELSRQAKRVNPDKAIAPMNTRSHKGKGRPMPPVERK